MNTVKGVLHTIKTAKNPLIRNPFKKESNTKFFNNNTHNLHTFLNNVSIIIRKKPWYSKEMFYADLLFIFNDLFIKIYV